MAFRSLKHEKSFLAHLIAKMAATEAAGAKAGIKVTALLRECDCQIQQSLANGKDGIFHGVGVTKSSQK
jgi:hypothetical protein